MWWAILTRREEAFKAKLDTILEEKIIRASLQKDEKKLNIQNKIIRKINKVNIEYKYEKATKSMIHDWEKSQVNSMLWALRYIWLLA
jgi:hypothetical protein